MRHAWFAWVACESRHTSVMSMHLAALHATAAFVSMVSLSSQSILADFFLLFVTNVPADARYLLGVSYPSSEGQHVLTV